MTTSAKKGLATRLGAPSRARGRSLSDFGKLSAAEEKLIEATSEGQQARFGNTIPTEEKESNKIRGPLIRFLLLGGDNGTPVHEHGVSAVGAWIVEDIDLDGCKLELPLRLHLCRVAKNLTMYDSDIKHLQLSGCEVQNILGDRTTCHGSIHLRHGFHAKGFVRFARAIVRGDLDFTGAILDGGDKDNTALICAGITVNGNVSCVGAGSSRNNFHAKGTINLSGARITGYLDFANAKIEGGSIQVSAAHIGGNLNFGSVAIQPNDDVALNVSLAHVGGSVFFARAHMHGNVRLLGARIAGDLDFTHATFRESKRKLGDLVLTRVDVAGRLIVREMAGDLQRIVCRAASVGGLIDDIQSWEIAGSIILDGFHYNRFLDIGFTENGVPKHFVSPTDAVSRITWLKRQQLADLRQNFKPQPWAHLFEVLRAAGHEEEAKQVAISREKMLREAGKIKGAASILHALFGILAGFGFRPLRLVAWVAATWFLCGLVFQFASEYSVMAPTNPRIFENPKSESCRPHNAGNWATCDELPYEYTTFNAWLYSLDLLLPLVDLQQDKDWAPMIQVPCANLKTVFGTEICWDKPVPKLHVAGSAPARAAYWVRGVFVWAVMWLEILFGWVASLLLAAVLAGLAKQKD